MERLPDEFTCKGEGINPPLIIEGVPEETQSLAIIVEDPDAVRGTWDHWILYNIVPGATEIGPDSKPEGGIEVTNSFGDPEYGAPCPPPGKVHRYFFKAFALDVMLDENVVMDKPSLLIAMEGHILAKADLVGTYGV